MNRFWSKVDAAPADCCWEWLASKSTRGYGQFRYQAKVWRSHRVAYQLAKGDIPQGLLVRHTCDNRLCCNPSHLILGTCQDNSDDMVERGGQIKAKGEANNNAKFTDEQIRQVFLAKGTCRQIAKQFNISPAQVSYIKRRISRKGATDGL